MTYKENFYIDYKSTVWERLHFNSKEELDEAVEAIERADGKIDGVFEYLPDSIFEVESIYETSEALNPEDNGDQPTVEAYKKGILIYDNVNKHLPNG